MKTFKSLREELTSEEVKNLLQRYGVEPHYENDNYITFPTVCHNPIGQGSYKLYYYKNTHMFKCYTECNSVFDIFDLIIKIEGIQGNKIGKIKALEIAGFNISSQDADDLAADSLLSETARIKERMLTEPVDLNNINLKPIDADFLEERYIFDINGLQSWIQEGIGIDTMLFYHIMYDPIENCIIIPHFNAQGKIVGVRGRFLNEDAVAKYKPIVYNGKLYNHPTGKTLYGYYQNKHAIMLTKTCIIFESEKSVLMMDTIYDKNNISVATSGQTITREQIRMLVELKVNNIILAYDADYQTDKEAEDKFIEYKNKTRSLLTYFNVSIIMDYEHLLGYKDSPVDKGKEIFEKLMKERVQI